MGRHKTKRNKHKWNGVALFNAKNEFICYCSRKEAKSIVLKKKGEFINNDIVKLKSKKMLVQQVRQDDSRTCYICGRIIDKTETATVDHIIPVSRDKNAWCRINMRCCCERCNFDKGNKTLMEYISHIEKNRNRYLYISARMLKDLKQYAQKQEREYKYTTGFKGDEL